MEQFDLSSSPHNYWHVLVWHREGYKSPRPVIFGYSKFQKDLAKLKPPGIPNADFIYAIVTNDFMYNYLRRDDHLFDFEGWSYFAPLVPWQTQWDIVYPYRVALFASLDYRRSLSGVISQDLFLKRWGYFKPFAGGSFSGGGATSKF